MVNKTTDMATSKVAARRIRLAARIYLTAILLLVLFLVVLLAAFLTLRELQDGFSAYTEASQSASELAKIDHDLLDLQRRVATYTQTRSSASIPHIRNQGNLLLGKINGALYGAQQGQVKLHDAEYRLKVMRTQLGNYMDHFDTVVEERELRIRIVEEDLAGGVSALRDQLADLVKTETIRDADSRLAAIAIAAATDISAAENYMLQYLNTPNNQYVERAMHALQSATAAVQQSWIEEFETEGLSGSLASETLEPLDELERDFLRLVQATRAYLNIVNVVMAGEAAEFIYQSDRLQLQSAEAFESLGETAKDASQRAYRMLLYLSLGATLLGVLVAAALIREAVTPILDITATVGELLQGKSVEEIPGLNRGDEIGDMARMADRLQRQKEETEKLLKQSEQLTAELEKSNQDLDSFAYVASHDLKSPLRAIDNVSQWIVEDAGDVLPAKSREHLGILRERIARMENLLTEILAYSRAGRITMPVKQVDTTELIQDLLKLIDWPADAEMYLDPKLPTFLTNSSSFGRVMMNLLTNAVKYRSEDPLRVCVSVAQEGGFFVFEVGDNGIGIEPRHQESIFNMFKRLHRHEEVEGTGMGLALVKKLVEAEGGEISVESTKGEGARFRFSWPQVSLRPQLAIGNCAEGIEKPEVDPVGPTSG